MVSHPQSLIIVGGGIVGLCLATAARARGYAVTVIARDAVEDTASGVAAGMIAPALEALGEAEPEIAFARLKQAQRAWRILWDAWPDELRHALELSGRTPSRYVWPQSDNSSDLATPRLKAMGVAFDALTETELAGVATDCDGVSVAGDGLIESVLALRALKTHLVAAGIEIRQDIADVVTRKSVRLSSGDTLTADAVVIAAGYGAKALAADVPSLGHLSPIKGHVLDLVGEGHRRITRSPWGYLAEYGAHAKFGASMQFDHDDLDIESDVVADLKSRAVAMLPGLDLANAVPRVGVRASTPDGWPLIGRDAASGVWVAVGMRRNGFVFAPFAAQLILAEMAGEGVPEVAAAYDPNRF
ncbi:MAG TPA: FAD-dependent oxidoreductase [Asticcacaulis sp.]|nr:FAD-dependent oxidoreductase [Asticcacaulis sp.]